MEDRSKDAPKLAVDVHRRTTQLNIWIVIGVLLFFAIAGFYVVRLVKDPPESHEEMKQSGRLRDRIAWAGTVC